MKRREAVTLRAFQTLPAVVVDMSCSRYARLRPVPLTAVTLTDAFWAPRLAVNHEKSAPHNLDTCESTGRIRNFAQNAGVDKTPFRGHIFHDSDVYKVLEGVAHCVAIRPDPSAGRCIRVIRIIGLCISGDLCARTVDHNT